jgi:SP family general alpha glucoside:H+ symporter-like MFS transporter
MKDNDSHTGLVRGAKAATDDEKKMTLLEGIRLYPKAVMFSILISTCIAMEGYDLCLLGNFCESLHIFLARTSAQPPIDAFPQFNRKFGHLTSDGSYQVSAAWQAGLSNVCASGVHILSSSHPSFRQPTAERS